MPLLPLLITATASRQVVEVLSTPADMQLVFNEPLQSTLFASLSQTTSRSLLQAEVGMVTELVATQVAARQIHLSHFLAVVHFGRARTRWKCGLSQMERGGSFFQCDTEVSKEVCSPSLNIYERTKVISFYSLSLMASALWFPRAQRSQRAQPINS